MIEMLKQIAILAAALLVAAGIYKAVEAVVRKNRHAKYI